MNSSFVDKYFQEGLASTQQEANALFLKDMAVDGLYRRGITPNSPDWEKYTERLKHELNVINSGNLADFFLDTAFICLKQKSQGVLLGRGRGGAAGSLVSYCLKITESDRLEFDLKFERFLIETRINSISSADIDIDIPRDARQKVLATVKDDFGHDRTYQVINKVRWTIKTAIKDLCTISGVPFSVANKVSKIIGDETNPDAIEYIPEVDAFFHKYPFVRDNYRKLIGMLKNYSIHAGGLIILDAPVEYHDSIVKVNGVDCLDNDGKTCDSLGYLKQDLLGINTLTIVSDCLDILPEGIKPPTAFDDPKVYETINKSTLGLFQIEAAGANQVCQELRPSNFDELTALLAICRPGSVDSGDKDRFVNRKHGLEEVTYDHPDLEPILKQNYGTLVYQEDLMTIVTDFAGMTPIDADNIRRGVGKKLQYVFDEYYPKFIEACINRGVDRDVAETIWGKMEASASYSFNKSHAVSYAALTYITAYLKTYYPVEFLLAVLNNTKDEEKRIKIYNELESLDKKIVNPDINNSRDRIVEDDENIYLSFNLVKGVGPSAIDKIIQNRPYTSFDDFCDRSGVNKTVKKALIECGAFDCFDTDRCKLFNIVEESDEQWDKQETLLREFKRIKINPRGSVLDSYDIKSLGIDIDTNTIQEITENKDDYKDFFIKVLVSEYKTKDDFAYLGITDGFNVLSIFVGKEFIPRYVDAFKVGTPLLIHVNGKGTKYSVLSLIDLNDPSKYQHEYWLYNGEYVEILKDLQSKNTVPCGVASNVKYFTSKKGNPCVRYDLRIDEETFLEGRIKAGDPPLMCEGSFVFFEVGNNPTFPYILEVH